MTLDIVVYVTCTMIMIASWLGIIYLTAQLLPLLWALRKIDKHKKKQRKVNQ